MSAAQELAWEKKLRGFAVLTKHWPYIYTTQLLSSELNMTVKIN